jgi:hypothetical protein
MAFADHVPAPVDTRTLSSAVADVFNPVPPCAGASIVDSPVIEVMSLFAPDAAAPNADLAVAAVTWPVPPLAIGSVFVT